MAHKSLLARGACLPAPLSSHSDPGCSLGSGLWPLSLFPTSQLEGELGLGQKREGAGAARAQDLSL